jgi:hypothetical protein
VDINDIKTVLKLARAELDDAIQSEEFNQEDCVRYEKAIEAVELWLIEIGALPPR